MENVDTLLDGWLGNGNYDVWCISLTKASDRRRYFTKWANHIGLSFKFWDATDYLDLTEKDFSSHCNVNIAGKPVAGASACRISITKCMESYYHTTNKPYLFIFEDDAGFDAEDRETGSTPSDLSNKDMFLTFLAQCKEFDKHFPELWDQVWFGYYDDDTKNHEMVDDRWPMVCRSLGTSMTHAMMFRREAIGKLLPMLYYEPWKEEPIDSITKYTMAVNRKTILPPKTIVCQTGHERCIKYNNDS